MERIRYLLVPVIIPLIPLLGLFFTPQTQRRRRFITGGLLFTIVFAFLGMGLQGSVKPASVGWLEFSLQSTPLGGVFSLSMAVLLCLTGIFGFEVLDGKERNYYIAFLTVCIAVQAVACMGSLPLFLAAWLAGAIACDALVKRNPKGLRFYHIGTAISGALLVVGTALAISQRTALTFLPHTVKTDIALPAALLVAGFALHTLVCQLTPAAAPTSVVLYVGMGSVGLFGVIQTIYYLFGISALEGTFLQSWLPPVFLLIAFAAGLLALRSQNLTQRLGCLAASQSGIILFGLCALQKELFIGAALLLVLGDICMTALLLCSSAFRYTQGKTLVSQLEGIGRQMPLALFCFGCAAFGLVGLPPFAGSVSRWHLACGALSGLDWGIFAVLALLLLAALTALSLLKPLNQGFFPGREYETDTKLHYGACVGVPIAILAAVLLFMGLFPIHLLQLVQTAACLFG